MNPERKSTGGRLLRAILILPGTALVYIPALLLFLEEDFTPGWAAGVAPKAVVITMGCALAGFGLFLAYHTMSLFAGVGEGTPAPWDPPRKLVVQGAYRRVRNPMISSVLFVLLGESLITGSRYLLAWAVVFFLANHVYFVFFEEPRLEKRFGGEYREYKEQVPRWVPRLRPYGHFMST